MISLPRYYLPTAISAMLGAAFGIAAIDTIEAIILGRCDVYITTGSISLILLLFALLWFRWRKGEPTTFSNTPRTG